MTSQIDKTYFIRDILIPNIATDTDISDVVDTYIVEYQEKILMDLLGSDLYYAFESGLLEDPVPQKWLNLRDGATYTINYNGEDFTVKWKGFKNSVKISLLSYFTYFYYVRSEHVSLTGIGATVSDTENGQVVLPNNKIIAAYNKGVELYGQPLQFNADMMDSIVFPNTMLPTILPISYNDISKPTAYNFIYRMNELDPTTYPNWVFKVKRTINNFGL